MPVGACRDLLEEVLGAVRRAAAGEGPPAHRALDDARRELGLWRDVRGRAIEVAARWAAAPRDREGL